MAKKKRSQKPKERPAKGDEPQAAAGKQPEAAPTQRKRRSRQPSRAAQRHQRFNRIGILIIVGVVALFAIPFIVSAIQRANLPGEHVPSLGHAHIPEGSATPEYNSNPPTSGPHYAALASPGSYDHELADPLLVHNMEDGYVILWYRMGDEEHNQERIRELEEAAQGYRMVVIAPREDLDTEYAVTAWQRIDKFDEYDPERIRRFLEAFEGVDNHPGAGGL